MRYRKLFKGIIIHVSVQQENIHLRQTMDQALYLRERSIVSHADWFDHSYGHS